MAKISPVSIKYMIHANFRVEGALEKPDVIGAIFGQTEGLLGSELEMRELQKEGKIGRIEVELERKNKLTTGVIKIPTALDQSETTLIAAAMETIEKIGPCDSQIEVDTIEDVRQNKRDYILERAKKLMSDIRSTTDSREFSKEIKDSARTANVQEYGKDKLPSGDLSGKEVIVVEGRADVLNLLRAGVNNVISMNGTKLPETIKELSQEKDITLFVDGDRGGKLIIKNVLDNARVKDITIAPDGKEVEELNPKEILICLRKKMSVEDYQKKGSRGRDFKRNDTRDKPRKVVEELTLGNEEMKKVEEIYNQNKGSGKAILLDGGLNSVKEVSSKGLARVLKSGREHAALVVIDGTATASAINSAEEAGVQAIVAKNFATADTKLKLLSF